MIVKFEDDHKNAFHVDQHRRRMMLTNMIKRTADWYSLSSDKSTTFENVTIGMTYQSIAAAVEACTADELAEWIMYLAIVRHVAEVMGTIAQNEKLLKVVK